MPTPAPRLLDAWEPVDQSDVEIYTDSANGLLVNDTISKRALIQRLRRALRAEGKHLRTARAKKRKLFGHYYLVGRRELIENVDIEKLARDLGLLRTGERLAD